jgi:CTP:molybdopterin cytidylyltransferase MocA
MPYLSGAACQPATPNRMYQVRVEDAAILLDMDTPEDYARLAVMVNQPAVR